jgi:uncharacterized protein (DUF4415 family)/uncharacterized DUF497 family protein
MRFVWDAAKDSANRQKHLVSFSSAQLVFDNPFHVSKQDCIAGGEQRWQTIGLVQGVVLLLLAHAYAYAEADGKRPYALFQRERQTRLNGGYMRKDVKHEDTILTDSQTAELKALQHLPDCRIDYADTPASNPQEWRDAVVGKFYRPIKQQLTLRIDADVVDWFKKQGKGYQTRINELLRDAMTKEAKH